jgi:hypothetical protein
VRVLIAAVVASAAPACSSLLDLQPPPVPVDTSFTPLWSFHDDFETGDLSRWHTASSPNGTLGVATSGAHAGCCALHATLDATGAGFQYGRVSWTDQAQLPPVTSGTIAVRAYVRADALDRDTRELSLTQGDSDPDTYATAGLGLSDPGMTWGFILQDQATGKYSRQASAVAAYADWHCVEYVVNVATSGELAIFVDGAATPAIEGVADTIPTTGWSSVDVGLGFASGVTISDVDIDDVAIAVYADTSPGLHIACDQDP